MMDNYLRLQEQNLLDTYDGQLSKTARALGINRYTLRSWRDKRKKSAHP